MFHQHYGDVCYCTQPMYRQRQYNKTTNKRSYDCINLSSLTVKEQILINDECEYVLKKTTTAELTEAMNFDPFIANSICTEAKATKGKKGKKGKQKLKRKKRQTKIKTEKK